MICEIFGETYCDMTKKEKMVMSHLCNKCQRNKTYLISPQELAQVLAKRYIVSVEEIDEMMVSLSNDNLIEFVVSDGKNGYFYCVTLKKSGQTFVADTKKKRKTFGLLVLRSCFLATVSFIFGVILRAIFKS